MGWAGEGELDYKALRSTRHVKYWCCYHFVWIPKYRRKLFTNPEVRDYAEQLLRQIATEIGCEPLAVAVNVDHVHVVLICPPRLSPSFIANYLKGKSTRKLLQRFPELRAVKSRYGRLWSRSYFVATVGRVSVDVIRKYVEEQSRLEGVEE